MTTLSGVYTPRLYCLRPILRRWIRLNTNIAQSWRSSKYQRDQPWWYNERASLSVLAGAVWQCRGLAFEEFSEKKRFDLQNKVTPSGLYNGRVDIYLEVNRHSFIGESKFCWVGVSQQWHKQAQRIKKILDHARSDMRKSHPKKQRRLAIVFVSPYLPQSRKDGVRDHIEGFLEQTKTIEVDAAAWIFPDIERSLSDRGRIYPGTTVLIKEVNR